MSEPDVRQCLAPLLVLWLVAGCQPEAMNLACGSVECEPARWIGRQAPLFALTDQDGRQVNLERLRGRWVVLHFYPREDTPDCACHATEYTDMLMHFHDLDAVLLGIDDLSPKGHRAAIARYHITMSLLSDADRAVSTAYEAWAPGAPGRAVRATFIVDPSGTVRAHWLNVTAKDHVNRVRQRLTLLQASG